MLKCLPMGITTWLVQRSLGSERHRGSLYFTEYLGQRRQCPPGHRENVGAMVAPSLEKPVSREVPTQRGAYHPCLTHAGYIGMHSKTRVAVIQLKPARCDPT